jgi:hypothetical protein
MKLAVVAVVTPTLKPGVRERAALGVQDTRFMSHSK